MREMRLVRLKKRERKSRASIQSPEHCDRNGRKKRASKNTPADFGTLLSSCT
jgi:hypothetical protein